MLVTLQSVLAKAQRGKYAVGAFNISDLEQLQGVMWAAEKLRSPVIINTSTKAIAYGGLVNLSAIVQAMATHSRVPVVLNLDHGRALVDVKNCLRAGWTGVMFDGSTLPWSENIRRTAAAKRMAQVYGVGVEGEIGQVKYPPELKKSPIPILATPDQAQEFVRRTKVDALAVGIGNSHGLPIPGERLHFDVLQAIHRAVRLPLVLHGASGTLDASIRRAISLGICKINIDTDLRLAFTAAVRQALTPNDFDPRSYLQAGRLAVYQTVVRKITLFGSRGKVR